MAITQNNGRQYPLVAIQDITGTTLENGANNLISLPPNSIVTRCELVVETNFDATTTLALAGGGVTLGATSIAASGLTAATVDGTKNTAEATIVGTASQAVTVGEGRVVCEYIIDTRANEVQ